MLTIFKAQSFLILTFFLNWTKTSKGEIEYEHHIFFFNLKYFHNFHHGEIIT